MYPDKIIMVNISRVKWEGENRGDLERGSPEKSAAERDARIAANV